MIRNQHNQLIFRVLAMVMFYLILKFMGGSLGRMALYPVTLLVTFLHEFGHALGAILTGGKVTGLQVNSDGSGMTTTLGGSRSVILMGGYLGSALLGNLLFFIGAKRKHLTQTTLYVMAGLMAVTGLIWFQTFESTIILWLFSAALYGLARYTDWDQDVLMFLGLAAVMYIIQDFNVGPSSDLAMYEQVVGVFPKQIWMYFWLFLAGGIFAINLKNVFGGRR